MTEIDTWKDRRSGLTEVPDDATEPTVAGKCEPDSAPLQAAADRGFDAVELYLEREHLDTIDAAIAAVRESPLVAVSVHTPHVTLDEVAYYELADDLAVALDAYLVLHSKYVMHAFAPDVEAIGFDAPHGHENNTGASVFHLEEMILARGTDLVLDTAHLYTAEPAYESRLEYLLSTYPDQIGVIHLTDGTRRNDGLPFGDGTIDLAATIETIRTSAFDGPIVLEVEQAHQAAARRFFETM